MPSAAKTLAVLALFTPAHPVWEADALCTALGCSRATGYRHLKELVDVGWLSKTAPGQYALGFALAQLHQQLHATHPLLHVAAPALHEAAQASGQTVRLCVLVPGPSIVNLQQARPVHALSSPLAQPYAATPAVTPAAGAGSADKARAIPTPAPAAAADLPQPATPWAGAAAQVLLSTWPAAQLRSLCDAPPPDGAAPVAWAAWRQSLATVQRTGVCVQWPQQADSMGEVAVAVCNPAGTVVGALAAPWVGGQSAAAAVELALRDAAWGMRKAQGGG